MLLQCLLDVFAEIITMTTDTIEISAAALNYDTERQILARALLETDAMLEAKHEFSIGDPGFVLGWYVFTVSVSKGLALKILNLQRNIPSRAKGSIEKNFLNWLIMRLKDLGSDMHIYNGNCICSVCSRSCC